jgi:hypothetical protein
MERLRSANFVLNESKCSFRKAEVSYLGHTISASGVRPNGEKVAAILRISAPKCLANLQSFLGMTNYYRRFIPRYSDLTEPLHALTRSSAVWHWDQIHENAFNELKSTLAQRTTLQFPVPAWTYVVATDASNTGLGATLCQKDESNNVHVIAYLSRTLTNSERNLSTIEKECLAIVWSISKWRHYLLGPQTLTMVTVNEGTQHQIGQMGVETD